MITKEKIKNEIDLLSEADLNKVYLFLSSLMKDKRHHIKIRSFKLGGKLDEKNIRSLAYE